MVNASPIVDYPLLLTPEATAEGGWQMYDVRCFSSVPDLSVLSTADIATILGNIRAGYTKEDRPQAHYDLALRQLPISTIGMTDNDSCGAIYIRNPNPKSSPPEKVGRIHTLTCRARGFLRSVIELPQESDLGL